MSFFLSNSQFLKFFYKIQRKSILNKNLKEIKMLYFLKFSKVVTLDNMNKNLKTMEYAVRGPLLIRANEIEKEIASGQKKPFKRVIRANLGDGQAMGQKPISFYRQVLSLLCYPQLLCDKNFPSDVVFRVKELLSSCRGNSVGAYTESFGIEIIRRHVAEFIAKRDGFESNWNNIILSAGASEAIKNVLKLLNENVNGKRPGVMIPIPQYPLYSAVLAELGMELIGYYLKEDLNWSLDVEDLQKRIYEARNFCNPRAIVIINPGNPTGQVLSKTNIEFIIKFAYENNLVLMADEVYQANIYSEGSKFYSFKKVINELGRPYSEMELASFMSCSKGFVGECGIRGGYCEMVNFSSDVMTNFSKCISAMLCPTTMGQCLMDCVVKPPHQGEPSYGLFCSEKSEILNNLKVKAKMVHEFFNNIKGFSCNEVQGAMYAFPKIDIPQRAQDEAKSKNLQPDTFYAFELLESTGICIIPGSGFKQEPGTYHFRTTILPPVEELRQMLEIFKGFHGEFLSKYG